MADSGGADAPQPAAKSLPGSSRRLPGRTPSGLLGQKPGTLQLNSSSTPATASLPTKRRGSFQQLKKAGTQGGRDGSSSHLDSDSSPSIFAVVKKSTHWEKYGTVLVLLVADELSSDKEAVLQVLSAEGYDDSTTDDVAEAVKLFNEKEVYPDIVIVDSDNELVDTKQLIRQLQAVNPTVSILVLGSRGGALSPVAALQAGASDFMTKPLDLDELVARVERHVQRQHCIKMEMEKALEDAKAMMQRLMPASLLGDVMMRKDASAAAAAAAAGGGSGAGGKSGLNSVAETDFEEQMSELSDENHRLGQKVQEMERKLELKDKENRDLEAKLNAIDRRVAALASAAESSGGAGAQSALRGQLDSVAQANLDLRHKVDELERLMQSTVQQGRVSMTGRAASSGSGQFVLGTGSSGQVLFPSCGGGGAGPSGSGSSSGPGGCPLPQQPQQPNEVHEARGLEGEEEEVTGGQPPVGGVGQGAVEGGEPPGQAPCDGDGDAPRPAAAAYGAVWARVSGSGPGPRSTGGHRPCPAGGGHLQRPGGPPPARPWPRPLCPGGGPGGGHLPSPGPGRGPRARLLCGLKREARGAAGGRP
ncbi:hypothetical protein HYH03_006390 [Edaphochlamys debaryana]|uniref:Response regulatory domain-containing protein n=1 Tax=Edaphochlamys debaryana TaxID=47281 RepID=A0A836C1E5_9CHLO|nr:hypothetical protein HYH03_006390 [Edaphochlamys debaryana]|eukprot:KAG2495444.1 hypothetical protein HYH03_006390 [Edaphochlamys debaryana]